MCLTYNRNERWSTYTVTGINPSIIKNYKNILITNSIEISLLSVGYYQNNVYQELAWVMLKNAKYLSFLVIQISLLIILQV